MLGLSTFVLFEATCRLAGWGGQSVPANAFAEFNKNRRLFTLSDDGSNFQIAEERRLYFAKENFPAQKSTGTFRVFVLGGSTVQGRPFSIPTSFGTFLKLGLQHADPETNWEVVNCGGISYGSYRLLPIFTECLNYEPDLFIFCGGHNEFLECVTYGEVIATSPALRQTQSWLDKSHGVRLLRNALPTKPGEFEDNHTARSLLPEEVDAILDHQGGLKAYTRAALRRKTIESQFGHNLKQMVNISNEHQVPIVLMTPPSNLADCPPFKSEFSEATDDAKRKKIADNLKAAADFQSNNLTESIRVLEATTKLDPEFAFTWYQLGRSYSLAGQNMKAETAFIRARDEDICPLRMTSNLADSLQRVADENDIPHVDLNEFFATQNRDGIVGDDSLIDHVHPSFRGNQQIAFELIERLRDQFSIAKPTGWKPVAQETFDNHLQSLEDMYFLRGRQTLGNLRAWASGRADGPPLQLQTTQTKK